MHQIFSILTLSTLILDPLGILKAEEAPVPVAIANLVATALSSNPEIQFYESEIVAAKAGRRVAGRPGNPELDLEIGRKRSTGGGFSAEGLAYSVSLVQPIEWPGRIGLRKAIANGDIRLALLGLEQFKTHLTGAVRNLAFGLATAQDKAAVAQEVSDRFSAVKDVLVQREAGGVTPLLEIRAIDAASIVMEKEAFDAAVEMQKALLKLNQLMGRRADRPLVVRRTDYDFPEVPSIGELLASTLTNNYRMHVRRAELTQQGFRVSLAKNERFPTVKVAPYLSQEDAGERETAAGIGLSFELPIFRSGRAEVDVARARQLQAQAMMHKTARELEGEVAEAVLIYKNARKHMATWTPERVDALREAAELADRHYRLGAVPVSTYIELQANYLEALEAINDVKSDALEAALDLERLTGASQRLAKPYTNETKQP
jgi:cobalt-zinc-cadmium efflux system outer membrane protein